jgi:cytoskeletal protein CcmA (bactofilin family)
MVDIPRAEEFATVIGADAQFKGELTFQGGVRIDGLFEGSITTPGKILVSREGRLKAEVKAGSLVVEGQIEGNATVKDRVELRATCTLKGDLKAAKLNVVEGATFVGRCEVGAGAGAAASEGAGAHAHAPAEPIRPAVSVTGRR